MNILIVDDLLNNRKFLRDIVRPHGHCDMVSNGLEAVEIFEAELTDGNPYDLVLLDIMMPKMNGQDALKEMRRIESERGVPPEEEAVVIMVTAVDMPQNIIESFYLGRCTDYIVKPFTRKILLDKMKAYGLI